MRLVLLFVCALAGASFAFDTPPAPVTAPAQAAPPLERIAVIGASLSAGFGMDGNPDQMATSKLRLADVIEASLLVPHQRIVDTSTAMFFFSPAATSARMLKKMREVKPSAIVALDYLFWFGYGEKEEDGKPGKNPPDKAWIEAKRVSDLDAALKDLGAFDCPILLGDLPDMTPATLVKPVPMIFPAQVPAPETLKTLNEHIVAFAKAHPNVVVVPIAAMTARLQADDAIEVHGNTWPKGSGKVLLQADHLHPTVEGASAVWILAVDAWSSAQKDLPASAFDFDAAKVANKAKAGSKKNAKSDPAKKTADPAPQKSVKLRVGGG
jgi:hypothetical protein